MLLFILSFPFTGNVLQSLLFLGVFFSVASADFHPTTVKDHVMVKQVYRVLKTKDWMSCISECNGDGQCSSYNFELDAVSCPGHICELSKCAMNKKRAKGLIAKRGFVFQQVKPSQNEDSCKEQKKKTKTSTDNKYYSSNAAFIYSLYNINGYQPIKLNLTGSKNQDAIYGDSDYGPIFGLGSDLYICSHASTNKCSYTRPYTYQVPPGCSYKDCNFFAGDVGDTFLIDDIEVFYEIV